MRTAHTIFALAALMIMFFTFLSILVVGIRAAFGPCPLCDWILRSSPNASPHSSSGGLRIPSTSKREGSVRGTLVRSRPSQHRELEIHTAVRWFVVPFVRCNDERTHRSLLSIRVSIGGVPHPRSRGGQIFSNPRRTGRLVVSPRVTPPRKRPVHPRGSFRSREGGPGWTLPCETTARPRFPPDPPGHPFRSHPNAFCPRGRVWGVLIHISGTGAPATPTLSAKTRHDRSLFRSKDRHAREPTCWRTSQQKQRAQHERTTSEFRAREKTRRRSAREPNRGFGRNDAGKWKKEERIGVSEEQAADERRKGWLLDPTIFARKLFHFRNREETEANRLENSPGLHDP